ncbi:hypothetical protein ACFP2T_27150 [Plantactinospora solaniradicis]|uniref:Uncharacterized protein n=1 Tax=Plantactinospora solaniradicis TaxID=1723736 RepID=A0ABW1KDJ6_9ACTN
MIAVAALAVYLAWLVLAFGLRSLIQAHRTGHAGWHPPGGQPATVTHPLLSAYWLLCRAAYD